MGPHSLPHSGFINRTTVDFSSPVACAGRRLK